MYNSPIALLKGIKVEFNQFLASHQGHMFSDFVRMTKSDTDKENYRFLSNLPYLKEWLDEIDFKDYEDFSYEIENKAWQQGIAVDRHTLSDSRKQLGASIEDEIRLIAQNFSDFPDKLVYDLMIANGTCFDGGAFFKTTHVKLGTIDNLKTGTGTTLAQLETDLGTARNAMYGYVDGNGIPINTNPRFVVLAPTQLHDKFLTLRNSTQIYDGSGNKTNIYNQSFDIVLNHWQSTSDNDWYLININHPIKPFIYQMRDKPKFEMEDQRSKKYIKYFVTARMNAGYGNPAAICKTDN
jgi:phage major head subunit gpT-like protein